MARKSAVFMNLLRVREDTYEILLSACVGKQNLWQMCESWEQKL